MKIIGKIVLSPRFPECFIRAAALCVLVSLLLSLAFLNRYAFLADRSSLVASRELLFSAAGGASVSLAAYYCFCQRRGGSS